MIDTFAIYTIAGSPVTAFVAKGQTTGEWYIMPSCADGWSQRRRWQAASALGKLTERDENLCMTNPAVAEACLGIPRDQVAPGLINRMLAALDMLSGHTYKSNHGTRENAK